MPPRLPDRYRLNIRLGSDSDIEEWLAKDETLDRPVLIRYLAPESTETRHAEFLESVRAAASLTEMHLQRLFAAADTTASAYSVSEWDGGVTIEDRLRAGEALPVAEFLPNASGLCLALARFHATGGVHGAIDTSAVHYSAAHPVKLGAFGRQQRWTGQDQDTRALSEVLRAAITGTHDSTVMPSAVISGLHPDVDVALAEGIAGTLDATSLAYALASTVYIPPEEPEPLRPWKSLALIAGIVVLIAALAAIGLAADFDPESPFLYPVSGEASTPTITAPLVVVAEPEVSNALEVSPSVYDPLGDGTEGDDAVDNATDASRSTAWSTEAYSRPIGAIKEGVGLLLDVDGTPGAIHISGTADTTYVVSWSAAIPEDPDEWEHVGRGTLQQAEVSMQLPVRGGGLWRLWLTHLPEQPDGSFRSEILNVRFTS